MLVREYGFGLEFCLYVGDGFHHSFGHGFDFSAFDEGIHVSLELVVHFGGDNHPLVAVVADAHGHLAEEAPAFEVGKEVVLRDAGNLAHPVHHEGSGVLIPVVSFDEVAFRVPAAFGILQLELILFVVLFADQRRGEDLVYINITLQIKQ